MRRRTMAREIALKALYSADISGEDVEECARKLWEAGGGDKEDVREFADGLIAGVAANIVEIDAAIVRYAANWSLSRMASIDRNIMRLAVYELLYEPDTPPKVAINEAIEMAKKYGDKDSGKFVNGILDKINKTEDRKNESGR
jgi:transcription antitermination factor NusB